MDKDEVSKSVSIVFCMYCCGRRINTGERHDWRVIFDDLLRK
jgi:hypothetical protein